MADKIRAVIEEKKVLAPECHIPSLQAKKKSTKGEIANIKQQCFSIADNGQSVNHSLKKKPLSKFPVNYNSGDDRVKFYNRRHCETTTTKAMQLDFAGVIGDGVCGRGSSPRLDCLQSSIFS